MVYEKEGKVQDTDRRNLNSHYGNVTGFLQTLSLILNVGLMVYAHLGLSGVVYSSQPPLAQLSESVASDSDDSSGSIGGDNSTSVCTEADAQNWITLGGQEEQGNLASYCSAGDSSTGQKPCYLGEDCQTACWQDLGYSADCARKCFPPSILCGFQNCVQFCLSDPEGEDCIACAAEFCDPPFFNCTGFPMTIDQNETIPDENNTNVTSPGSCNYDLDVDQWYVVYNLTFIGSVRDTWEADVKLLSIIIVVFSGIWPYAKNLILILVWYVPMSNRMRSSVLLWLTRLSKYTLVDVFAVIILIVATQLDLNVGGVDAIVRSEARFGIIAFLLATVWEFIQIEWTVVKHNRLTPKLSNNSTDSDQDQQESDDKDNIHTSDAMTANTAGKISPIHMLITIAFFILTLGIYISGSTLELFRVETFDEGQSACVSRYNLATFGNGLITEVSLADNTTAGQTWTLYIFYLLFTLILPITTHVLQIIALFFWVKNDNKNKMQQKAMYLTVAIWGMSCVEVFLIGLFSVEYKFQDFIKAVAGEEDASFISVKSSKGPGFFVLIGYGFVAGLFQFYLRFWVMSDKQSSAKIPEVEQPQDAEINSMNGSEINYDA
mmetsp:Transcript_25141/g.37153  ORF Transcript_25141/g.37153 Transcript_25141/m.37153 type:complete len:605 (+) Transcript_25141:126-1940(+)|eukprot:CAMPEP_0194209264 /NCGR_PEP_ID=MMETSP0156-20130528/7455_1 /TAXON_ID=33649 /ORGANISM="Thalassionema nitzschioides, Strain L26-B" /LENGTH=604 /DNA_ID=CAMNT_0038936405 /DNA_START=6 /DNA_END=1820 /DNA_ORIENTATION=-